MYTPALLFLAILGDLTLSVKGISFQSGKLNMSQTFQDWSCGSSCSPPQHCHLPRCTDVPFPGTFSGSGKIQVHVSVNHGDEFSRVHSLVALWVQSVSSRGFEVCAREAGIGSNGTGIINWLAFQDQPEMTHGTVTFSGIWTTETKCDKVAFSQSFGARPSVFVSASYSHNTEPNDAMYAWLENIHSGGFEVCIREFMLFDGKHQDTTVDWFAFLGNGSNMNFTMAGEEVFPNSGTPTADDNYGFCQQVQYNTTFYASPVVLISPHHHYDRQLKSYVPPDNNIIAAWVEEVGLKAMRICVKDLSGSGSSHDPLSVSYLVIGDVDPCLNVICPSFGVCKTYSAHEARCECNQDCPSYQDPVCTSNATTYDNKCWHELSYCKGLDNNIVYHPGSCEGFPIVRGRVDLLRVPKWTDSTCQTVVFPPYRFYPDKQVQVQITVNHMKRNDSKTVHDAVTSWTENVNTKNFTVCVMQTGRSEENFNPFATVDWVASQGAPPEGMTGKIIMQKWWSGTKCADMAFPKDKFDKAPAVLVTAEHLRTGKEYDASLVWTEDVTKSSFKVCLREMQNFDGKHADIDANWLAFSERQIPFFAEHGSINFLNTNPPTDANNNAYCEFVKFEKSYKTIPTVITSANHSTATSGNTAPEHNGIATWIENLNATGFRACVKELYETRYDPVSVNYAVLTDICDPEWSYFNGFCYFTSQKCANWTTALTTCRQKHSLLADISNDEENVFIQHVHNGDKSWLGLNDISTEGSFTWEDRGAGNFTAWAKNQPNNFGEEDCVHALGVEYKYEWNDVKCSDCHQFTCKKDFDECVYSSHSCDVNANCTNIPGSYKCACKPTYNGDGKTCISYRGLSTSSILGSLNSKYLDQLISYLNPVLQSSARSKFKRCWHGNTDGWAASTFHSNCDGKGPTVTIIKVGSYIFGGYSDLTWYSSSCDYDYSYVSKAFIYSLYNVNGYAPVKREKNSGNPYSVYRCSSYGPTFGNGHDIYISDNAASNGGSYTYCGHGYPLPPGYSSSGSSCRFYAGSYQFVATDIEVFYETTT